jgi:hypothetical protein
MSLHQGLLGPTGAHWLDNPSDLSCKDSSGRHAVDDPRLSCKQRVALLVAFCGRLTAGRAGGALVTGCRGRAFAAKCPALPAPAWPTTSLEGKVDHVIGVDTHRDSHSTAFLDANGGLVAQLEIPSDQAGAQILLGFVVERAPGRRCWAVEGTGCYGAGLASFLADHGEWVVEVDRPKRPPGVAARSSGVRCWNAASSSRSSSRGSTAR